MATTTTTGSLKSVLETKNYVQSQREDMNAAEFVKRGSPVNKVAEDSIQNDLITNSPPEKENGPEEEKNGIDIATLFEMAAKTTYDFKGFKSFRGFRRLEESKINELVELTKTISTENSMINDESIIDENSTINKSILDEVSRITESISHEVNRITKSPAAENSKIIESISFETSKITKIISNEKLSEKTDINESKKIIRKKSRKKRKNWILKKRPCTSNQNLPIEEETDVPKDLFEKLYKTCLDVANSDSGDNNINLHSPIERSVFSSPISDVEPLLCMAKEVINNLKTSEIEIKKEKKLQQQNQKSMLQKLIKLLKEKVPGNDDTDFENNLSSEQVPLDESTHVSRLKKLKNNFYGFRTVNPQTRDRGGLITAERLFADSPPSSPIREVDEEDNDCVDSAHDTYPSESSNSKRRLDFVFGPLHESGNDSEFVPDNFRGKRNGVLRSRRLLHHSDGLIKKSNQARVKIRKMRKGLSFKMKNLNRKLISKRKLVPQLGDKREEELPLKRKNINIKIMPQLDDKWREGLSGNDIIGKIVPQMDDKWREDLPLKRKNINIKLVPEMEDKKKKSNSRQAENKLVMPKPKVKSLFSHRPRQKPGVVNQVSGGESSENNSNVSVFERRTVGLNSCFSFRGFSGPFGSPKKSDTENVLNDISGSLPASSSVTPTVSRPSNIRGVKRKLDPISSGNEINENSKVLRASNDINLTRSDSVVSNDDSNRILRNQPVPKIKKNNRKLNGSINQESLPVSSTRISPRIPSIVEPHSNEPSENLPSSNAENSILYYPVHPFISHDLPVHFIPVEVNNIPPYLPLYAPRMDFKSKAPIYPSFIRTRPSTAEAKSPSKYSLYKGINAKNIPHRSFSEDKVRDNLFSGISSVSNCPLYPEVKTPSVADKNLLDTQIKSSPKSAEPTTTTIHANTCLSSPNGNENSSLSNGVSSNDKLNKKVHKCLQCDFVTPKLGVFKRHELVHSNANSIHNGVKHESKFQNTKSNSSQSVDPLSRITSLVRDPSKKVTDSVFSTARNVKKTSTKTVNRKPKLNSKKR